MEGVFLKRKRAFSFALFLIACGTVTGFLFGRMILSDIESTSLPNIVFCLLFMLFFLSLGCIGMALLLFNSGAYFKADDNGIAAKFGLYGDKLWKWSEILCVDIGGSTVMLTLQSNKEYHIGPLVNAKEVFRYCKDRVSPRKLLCSEEAEALLYAARKKQKRNIIYVVLFLSMIFVSIFVCAGIVGEDLEAVNTMQTIVFCVCTFFGIAFTVLSFVFAEYSGKYTLVVQRLENDMIYALVSEKTRKAFENPEVVRILYFEGYRQRLVIYKVYNKESSDNTFYGYCIEEFDFKINDWKVVFYASEIASDEYALLDYVYELYDDTVFEEYSK